DMVSVAANRLAGRRLPVGMAVSGVVPAFVAARLQLRGDSDGPQPAAAVGRQAPGRPGFAVRGITGGDEMSTAAATHGITTADGRALSPAQYGLLSFLVSEVALFGTLIVTYIFYLGRDVMGGP